MPIPVPFSSTVIKAAWLPGPKQKPANTSPMVAKRTKARSVGLKYVVTERSPRGLIGLRNYAISMPTGFGRIKQTYAMRHAVPKIRYVNSPDRRRHTNHDRCPEWLALSISWNFKCCSYAVAAGVKIGDGWDLSSVWSLQIDETLINYTIELNAIRGSKGWCKDFRHRALDERPVAA